MDFANSDYFGPILQRLSVEGELSRTRDAQLHTLVRLMLVDNIKVVG